MTLAGFLLFQVQLVLGKFILPWFGGSASNLARLHAVLPSGAAGGLRARLCDHAPLDHPPASPTADRHPCPDPAPLADRALRQLEACRCERSHMAHIGAAGRMRRLALYRARNDEPLLSRWLALSRRTSIPCASSPPPTWAVPGLLSYPFFFERLLPSVRRRGGGPGPTGSMRSCLRLAACSRSAARQTRRLPIRARCERATTILCCCGCCIPHSVRLS